MAAPRPSAAKIAQALTLFGRIARGDPTASPDLNHLLRHMGHTTWRTLIATAATTSTTHAAALVRYALTQGAKDLAPPRNPQSPRKKMAP